MQRNWPGHCWLKLAGDAAEAWCELISPAQGMIHVVTTAEELARCGPVFDADLLVDAVVGTGFKPPLKGLALAALEWVKGSHAPVLAVDLAFGLGGGCRPRATVAQPVFPPMR